METLKKISELLKDVKDKKPLVHHITNYVTANDCANMVLSIGGSPVMADEIDEVEEMVSLSSALVINMGTLNKRTIEAMLMAGKMANKLDIPVILDPVGVGATGLRTNTASKLLKEINFSVIKGNMSEIKILSGVKAIIKGVDSVESMDNAEEIAVQLAKKYNCIAAITGKKDIVTDGERLCKIDNGHKMMADITGTGCMCTSLVGTFCGVIRDYYLSTIAGILSMDLSGEKAFISLKENDGTGTFKVKLMDSIYKLSGEDIMKDGNINEKHF